MNGQADSSGKRELLARLAADPPDLSLRIAVLAAHPDDETIGASALLARYSNSRIVYLTDGAPRDMKLWPPGMPSSREEYAAIRRTEARKALSHVGISDPQIFWLGGVDQDAIFEARQLALKLQKLLRDQDAGVLITHPYEGGHPDHDCAALVARLATEALGREAPEIAEMTSYHARDGRCVSGEFLNAESTSEIEFRLSGSDCDFKRKMMGEYKSQRVVLENFPINRERFRAAPAYDFSHAAHEGRLWYECMGWEMTGARWRELARRALTPFKECSCA